MSATNGNISGGCAKGLLPSSKQRSPESLALLDRCLEEGNELLAPPLEKSPVEDDVNRDVNDLRDDIDNKSLGSIDYGEEWFDPNTGEDSTYNNNTTGESEVQFGDPPSEGLRNLMGKTRFDYDDDKSAEGSCKKSKSSEKRKGSGTGKDKIASKAAKNTKYTSFKEHFNSNNGWLPKDLEGGQGFPLADQNELVYLGQMVDKSMDLDAYTKMKLLYNLNEKSEGKSFGEVWWSTVMSLSSKPPQKLKKGTKYDKNDCKVCKAADGKIVDQCDHKCPYCRSCFDKSGWKQECTLLEDCHGKCLELEGVDM